MDREYPEALPPGYRLKECEIVRVLGAGGFGITYLATDHSVNDPVAIKEYFPEGAASRSAGAMVVAKDGARKQFSWGYRRFLDEAGVVKKFQHPNVLALRRCLQANGTAYLVLDYVEGDSLSTILESRNHLSVEEWRPWLDQLLDGLEHVHANNYLHRDITPRNILIRAADNRPVLIDFGAARAAAGQRVRTVVLTPAYAPFEQHSARRKQGPFTDIYSLAAVSYRVLTGAPPPPAPDREDEDEYVPLGQRVTHGGEWTTAVDRALARKPRDRPQTVTEWRKELHDAAARTWQETGSGNTVSFAELANSPDTLLPVPLRSLRVIGIDLGTTNSAIAEIRVTAEGTLVPEPRCIDVEQPTRQGPQFDTVVPSVLALHDGQRYVGSGAKDLRARMGDLGLEQNRNIFWDCKNDIGVRLTYHKAATGFRSAREIAGHLLHFLMAAATGDDTSAGEAITITVPASFQAAQRGDTLDAARLAGIDLQAGALLDEPVAAFLDYIFAHGGETLADLPGPRRLAVFDFGGGTCDVALFELRKTASDRAAAFGVAPLSVSRYHRLGGGDIDRAIAVEVLIPQLIEQNALQPRELDYRAKSSYVIPALLGCAESLKVGLCREIARLKKFDRYAEMRSTLVQRNPGVYPCTLYDGSTLRLQSPTLSADQFDSVLEPFLDSDLLFHRETDYLLKCSVFAPLRDALERARLDPEDIDYCLLVGGSSLIPQVAETVDQFFTEGKILYFDDPERTQTAVAHGAAWQALSLAAHGHGLVRSVTGDSISIQTADGPVELIGNGAELPYPAHGVWAESNRLAVPEIDLTREAKLRVELRGSDERVLMRRIWEIPSETVRGEPLRLRYRMDVNQVLELRLSRRNEPDPAEVFRSTVENPLTSVVNPNAKRDEVLDLEERMRTGQVPRTGQRAVVERIAELESELGHHERALDLLGNLSRMGADVGILHHMGLVAGRMGDHEREEKFYRTACQMSSDWTGPLFNLALSQKEQGRLHQAMRTIDEAIARQQRAPNLILKASLIDKLDDQPEHRDALVERAFAVSSPLGTLSDFELGWYVFGARLIGDSARAAAAEKERKRRRKGPESSPEGVLPETRHEIARRPQ